MRVRLSLRCWAMVVALLSVCDTSRADEPLPPGLPVLAQAASCAPVAEAAGGAISGDSRAIAASIVPALTGSATKPQSIDGRLQQLKLAGVSVAVIHGGKLAWARGWGVRDTATCQPVTPATLFQAASMSKTLTAVLAMRQVQLGTIALDADINRALVRWHLPHNDQFPPGSVTLRQILSHTAGLSTPGFSGYPPNTPLPSLIDTLEGKAPANTPAVRIEAKPGAGFNYSGGGYMILQVALEDISRKDFATFAADEILGPLAMVHSSFAQPPDARMLANIATGHHIGRPFADKFYVYPERAAAGLWTTPSDMARFLADIRGAAAGESGHLVTPQTAAEMLKPGSGDWGLGFAFFGDQPKKFFGHMGGNWGFLSWMLIDPQSGDGIVVMTNGERGITMADDVIRAAANYYGWTSFRSRPLFDAVQHASLFIRGSMNDWGNTAPLASRSADEWQADVALKPGDHEFRIGSSDAKVDLGAAIGDPVNVSDHALALTAGGDNLRIHVETPGTYRFRFHADATGAARITVTNIGDRSPAH